MNTYKVWLQIRDEYKRLAAQYVATRDASLNPRLAALTAALKKLEEEMTKPKLRSATAT